MSKQYLMLALMLWMYTACNKKPEQTQPTFERITESVYASGTIKSKNQYQVFSTVSGLIQKILVQEGDLVKKGDPLFVIQNTNAQLNAENAQLSADYAVWNTRGDRLSELQGLIQTTQSRMLNDSILLLRQRGLWAQKIGSKVDLEQRELAFQNSKNNYEAAILRYKDLKKQLGFAAEQSKKLLNISQSIAQDYTVRSLSEGRVYSITKEPGELVSAQAPVAIVGDANQFVAELQIDESDIARVKKGLRVLLTLDSYKGQVFEALVSKIDPIMNERSRTFTIEATFVQMPPTLYPNLSTEANILVQTKEKALTIPRAYLMDDSLVVLPNNETRKVSVGLMDYQKAEILNGISAGETILKPLK